MRKVTRLISITQDERNYLLSLLTCNGQSIEGCIEIGDNPGDLADAKQMLKRCYAIVNKLGPAVEEGDSEYGR